MILAFDIGNTHIVVGLFNDAGDVIAKIRIASRSNLTEDELFSFIYTFFQSKKIDLKKIDKTIISSVVPDLITVTNMFCEKYLNLEPIIVSIKLDLPIVFSKEIEEPQALGADRLVNCVEANKLYPEDNLVIIDMGTATTFDILGKNVYMGGSILPGIRLSIDALFKNTAKLPNVKFTKPQTVFGRNTPEHINIGAYYGTLGQIKEILRKIGEKVSSYKLLVTGGHSLVFKEDLPDETIFIPDLNLKGLYTIAVSNS